MKYFSALFLKCIFFLTVNTVTGQEQIKDTLFGKTYEELNTLFFEWLPEDTLTARKIAATYIEKGRAEKDSVRMAKGYYYYASRFGPEMGLQYADTIIALTENSTDKSYPALGYMLKGYWHYQQTDYKAAVQCYLKAHEYAVERDNIKQIMSIRPTIAVLKGKSGDYRGALQINKEHLTALENDPKYRRIYSKGTFRDHYVPSYLNAIFNVSLGYIDLRAIDSAKKYARKGIRETLRYNDTLRYYWGISVGGKAEYYDGNYQATLDSMNKAIPHLTKKPNVVLAKYYVGKSYEGLGRNKKALATFMEVDTVAEKIDYSFGELRKVYEYMINHYGIKQQKDSQLVYIDKLLKLDEELLETRAMDGKIAREYDTPYLLRQKEKLINDLEQKDQRSRKHKLLMLVVVALFAILLAYYYQKQRIYKRRYRQLLSEDDGDAMEKRTSTSSGDIRDSGVPEETFRAIEKGLSKFEREKRFTNPDVTLYSLAKDLETNSTYLSKVVNTTRQMNFSKYLHNLRIDHVIQRLKNEERLRSYSMQGIAEEAGYNTAQSFANSFYRNTGIYPSYFVKRLQEEEFIGSRAV
ncbi:AraC family transcriptional regulator [Sinomicrobium kalidii]|uniref:helix-turn-helix domain-containing protein n=1 Tax=Sinomicrobium kalidii TaxID=2900738 RepID=UPI001E552E59|nr:helix-turn-helix domain-containing protein [Sinomicrobium kalidii]UGU14328.1 AraC family transcriptional regulator [Sinomicrobium kalidii]